MSVTWEDLCIVVVCGLVVGIIMNLLFSSNPLWVTILFSAVGAMAGVQMQKMRTP